jgi:protease-4
MADSETSKGSGGDGDGSAWERSVISKLAFAALTEQRRARRWGILFRFLLLAYLIALLVPLYLDAGADLTRGEHTALVKVEGLIASGADASAANLIEGLESAFEDKKTRGVLLRINSPGGSPVQAGQVYDAIRRLREENPDVPLYAVVTDLCASGGYYIAAAADEIYADKASLVGSIGVRMDSFGFVEAIEKLGVERRLRTAGEHKGLLDPFLPEDEEELRHVQGLLDTIHQQFIAVVKEGRGERLKGGEELFSGLIWTGEQAVELGLVDGLASPQKVAKEVIEAEDMVDFTPESGYLERLMQRLGTSLRLGLREWVGEPRML